MPDHGLSRTLIIAHISEKVKHYFFIFYETFFIILNKNYIFDNFLRYFVDFSHLKIHIYPQKNILKKIKIRAAKKAALY